MDIKQMLYFKTIVDEGTISKAAIKLHMAQPPLSMQLKSLEEELGTGLLIRGRRHVTLASAGRLFYRRACQMLALEELTLHEMKNVSKETLRIGVTSSNSPLLHENAVINYIKDNPTLHLRIKEGTTREIIDNLLAHDIDIGFIRTPFDGLNIKAYFFEKEPMVAIGPQEIIDEKENHLIDYKDYPLIVHRRYHSVITEYAINTLSFNPNIHIQADDCRTSIFWSHVLSQIAIIPKTALPLIENMNLKAVELEDEALYTAVSIAMRKDDEISQRAKEFIRLFGTQGLKSPH